MTHYPTIVTVLLVAAIVAIWKLVVKVINLHDELTRTEQDADAYHKQLERVETRNAQLCKRLEELDESHCELNRFASFVSDSLEKSPYFISNRHYMANLDVFDVTYTTYARNVVVKSFIYNTEDEEDRAHARLEAENLLDALNGKVGWRVNELGNP